MNFKDKRFYKVKKPSKKFLCALCSADREMRYSKDLSAFNYLQVALLWSAISYLSFSWLGLKSIFSIFIIWPTFELTNKFLYRREVACPYCGFDATWYKRDIKMAHQKVRDFWRENYPELVNKSNQNNTEQAQTTLSDEQAIYNSHEAVSHTAV